MIVGVGTDIVDIARFKDIKPTFVNRVFTTAEQEYMYKKSTQTIAGLFAAKEAVAKAIGTGFAGFGPRDIEIGHTALGQPQIKLHGNAKQELKHALAKRCAGCKGGKMQVSINISISHTATVAMAFVVVEVWPI